MCRAPARLSALLVFARLFRAALNLFVADRRGFERAPDALLKLLIGALR